MKSVMNHSFSRVPSVDIPRSSFARSHGLKTTFNSGYLVPILVDEVVPGDTIVCRGNGFVRMATPLYPVMDNMFMETFFFFVPTRLVWNNFQKFMGEQDNPGDTTDYLVPVLEEDEATFAFSEQSLGDYFGLPIGINFTSADNINSLPFRAHNLIFNTWFRDQNLQDSVDVPKTDGPDNVTLFDIYRRGKRHDYFTSCLPWPQKGPDVLLPMQGLAPVTGIGARNQLAGSLTNETAYETDGSNPTYAKLKHTDGGTASEDIYFETISGPGGERLNIYADLSAATSATLSQFREAIALQTLYERDARGGTRYTEIIRSHFGVISDDARLQRPEYLGGGSSRINVNPITSTVGSYDTDVANVAQFRKIGDLGGMAVGSFQGHGFTKSFTEHGYIIGYVNVRADLNYQQGLNRLWSRRDKLDFYWPALSQIGEQAVLNKEIYCQGVAAGTDDDDVFGYQERYAEYRYKPSQISGYYRSQSTQPLDAWHLAQDFASLPLLNDTFIQDTPPVDRVLSVQSGSLKQAPQFIGDFYFDYKAVRPMPTFGIPASLGRF